MKFTMGSQKGSRVDIISSSSSANYSGPLLYFNSNRLYLSVSSSGSSYDICNGVASNYSLSIVAGTIYYFKLGFSGTEYYLEYSTDGITYQREITKISNLKIFFANGVRIALLNSSNSTLDMNYFKLFKNNQQVEILLPSEE